MHRIVGLFIWGMVLGAVVNQAAAQSRTNFFTGNTLPPPNSKYISPAQWHALYANGIIISNVVHRAFTENLPPPPLGTSATHTFGSLLDFDLSMDKGATFSHITAPGQVTVNLQAVSSSGGIQIYKTEMLQLNISGGNLPAGLQVRASMTQPSTGQTTVAPGPGGGYMISSFFDVFTDVSLDGGQTWSPTTSSGRMNMRPEITMAPAQEPSPLLPPPVDLFLGSAQASLGFASGLMVKGVRVEAFSQVLNPFPVGVTGYPLLSESFNAQVDLMVSMDGGKTYNAMQVPAGMTVTVQELNPGPPTFFDTELTQLSLNVGNATAPILLRQSPTLHSYGATSTVLETDGTYRVRSFFDIFTELSLDGGKTWQPPTNGPTHVDLQKPGYVLATTTGNLPPTNGAFLSLGSVQYQNGIILSNVECLSPSQSSPPPPPGVNGSQRFNSTFNMMLSTDGGKTFAPISGPGTISLLLTDYYSGTFTAGSVAFYDLTLQTLSIAGGNIPSGMMVRQSPTKPSLGQASVLQVPGSAPTFRVDSFFDVFTELSLDGGQNWSAAVNNSGVNMHPYPGYAPFGVTCPSDITVYASVPGGAYVNYTIPPIVVYPDCPFGPFVITGSPVSGSFFPIGTNTVTLTGSDGCGEHPTCTFHVIVLPSFIYGGLVSSEIANALLSSHFYNNVCNVLTISNFTSSGRDGFHLYLGVLDSAMLNFQPFVTTANCPTSLVTIATGQYGSNVGQTFGVGTYQGGPSPTIQADFSALGAQAGILHVWDENNHLVASNYFANAAIVPINSFFPPTCTNMNKTSYSVTVSPDGWCTRFCIYGCNCEGTNCYIERYFCLTPILLNSLNPALLTDLQLTASAASPPGSFSIQSEEFGMFGLRHMAMGQATLESHPGILQVNNLGTAGQDGVLVDLGSAGELCMNIAPVLLQNQGACWQTAAYGEYKNWGAYPLGHASLTQFGTELQVQADFSALGATRTRVDIYNGTTLAGSISGSNGVQGALIGQGSLIESSMLLRPLAGFKEHFDAPFTFVPPSGTPMVTGNEIQILALDPPSPVQNLGQFQVTACGVGQFAILSEFVQPNIGSILRRTDGTFEIDGQGAAGMSYHLLASPTVNGPATQWVPVANAMSEADGTFHLIDGRAPMASQQFYKITSP